MFSRVRHCGLDPRASPLFIAFSDRPARRRTLARLAPLSRMRLSISVQDIRSRPVNRVLLDLVL